MSVLPKNTKNKFKRPYAVEILKPDVKLGWVYSNQKVNAIKKELDKSRKSRDQRHIISSDTKTMKHNANKSHRHRNDHLRSQQVIELFGSVSSEESETDTSSRWSKKFNKEKLVLPNINTKSSPVVIPSKFSRSSKRFKSSVPNKCKFPASIYKSILCFQICYFDLIW